MKSLINKHRILLRLGFSFCPGGKNKSNNKNLVSSLPINKYLKQNLTHNHIYQLKQFQYETLMCADGINLGGNQATSCFINSCTGSGKTLAYLLPVLNRLINARMQQIAQNKNKNKEEHDYKSRKNIHGAVILTLNKELCLQIYRTIRMLDPLQYLVTKRTGPITHYIPVINQLSNVGIDPNNPRKRPQPPSQQQSDLIDSKINANLVNTVKWTKTDILVSTPQLLYNLMGMAHNRNKDKNIRDNIAAEFIVVDEGDLLLQIDKNVSRHTFNIINEIKKNNKSAHQAQGQFQQKNRSYFPQIIISASSFPKKIKNKPSMQHLTNILGPLKQIETVQLQHQIPKDIDLYFVEIQQAKDGNTNEVEAKKEFYVQDIIKSRVGAKQQKQVQKASTVEPRFIIFCNKKSSLQSLKQKLQSSQALSHLHTDIYHASLDTNQRSNVLHRFCSGTTSILISTDLGSRGLDFEIPVDCVIEYEMAENVTGWINRVGRTGRNGVKGMVVSLVDKGKDNLELFQHMKEILASGGKLDEVFSRKRSYSKFYKNSEDNQEQKENK